MCTSNLKLYGDDRGILGFIETAKADVYSLMKMRSICI